MKSAFSPLAAAALAVALLAPAAGFAQSAPGGQVILPAPQPMPTPGITPIPYPAYGTPAPDVAAMHPKIGVPQSISLQQATKIAVALSPVFASQNAQWAMIHAKYTAEKQAVYPAVAASAGIDRGYSNGGVQFNNTAAFPSSTPCY